eukprot:CAMPEP_0116880424 /NCGR_PEP_ID=MMETSP0463-20121206/12350_1 /TAXON_ID=181622 /ORGANISM="Strombidinopsis sp, Strain SopsisLIS2011" /LENGTH=81 /DNA_ID=CAMNT_0004530983 /DNA_START=282 /DNA_END=527 /DNA_ORIENTATION=+
MLYFLAVEDFDTFHEFMFEANEQLNKEAVKKLKRSGQKEISSGVSQQQKKQPDLDRLRDPKTQLTEEDIMALAIAQSEAAD